MYYRVVIQGRTLGGADVDEVKRQFVRVTGLPARVAEHLFGGMPKVIKRQVPQTDAERIAATLRAIGAAATVERELPDMEDETPEGIQVVAAPLLTGPPTIIPGSQAPQDVTPPPRRSRFLGTILAKWPLLAGGIAVAAGVILLAPVVGDFVANLRRSAAPPKVAPARAPAQEAAQPVPALNATLLHGPWRCTNQRTGVSTYWSYGGDGTLMFHGEVLSERPASGSNGPTGWKLEGQRLLQTFAQREPVAYTVSELTLTRLRYGDERDLAIECRRP